MSTSNQVKNVKEADESTVEKIRKLLALAEDNQNENEREVAMKFALDLLSRHNLSVSQVKEKSSKFDVVEREAEFNLEPWVRLVLNASCCLYYTNHYIRTEFDLYGRRKRKPVFVGTKENIEVTLDVASWLLDSIRKESNRKYKDRFYKRSFRLGAGDKVFERALAMVEEESFSEGPGSTGSELMVIRMKLEKAVDDYLSTLDLRFTKGRQSYSDYDAYLEGESYAEGINLGTHDTRSNVKLAALPLFK